VVENDHDLVLRAVSDIVGVEQAEEQPFGPEHRVGDELGLIYAAHDLGARRE
jgi:hypothetical protein